jgi:anti-sigma regulatory factor (Ser/Thr protein kinase)
MAMSEAVWSGDQSVLVRVEERSHVGEARRLVRRLAERSGLDEVDGERAAIVTVELAGNVARHAGHGYLLARPLLDGAEGRGVEILAIDRGPGIADLAAALRDGYSTAGTPGTGLGAVRRLSQLFDASSATGQGTVILSRVVEAGSAPEGAPLLLGAICCAKLGEDDSGDSWAWRQDAEGFTLLLVDGLGHGQPAWAAAREAIAAFVERPAESPLHTLEVCHRALRGTRGAALAVARVEPRAGVLRYAGVGNIAARIISAAGSQHLVSMSGIVGQDPLRPREFGYPWQPGAMLVMASDGLRTSWSADAYGAAAQRHPALFAGLLLRDHERGRDDVTVVAARWGGSR